MGFFTPLMNLFRRNKQKRRSPREPIALDVMFFMQEGEMISGRAGVVNVNKGGVCLELDTVIPVDTTIALKINPHTVMKHIRFNKVMTDDRGHHIMKITWVREKEGGGCFTGGYFLRPDGTAYK